MGSKSNKTMSIQPHIFQLNERSILIQLESNFDPETLNILLSLKTQVQQKYSELILEVINTYNSLLITYKSTINNFYDVKEQLLEDCHAVDEAFKPQAKLIKIPVCYDEQFALDSEQMTDATGLDFREIINRHTKPEYRVYFIGFLPGFPYLGGLDSSLYCRRKQNPRSRIEMGSVGIAGNQTGIYPSTSPGGWQIIGKTPVKLFDKENSTSPSLLSPGDRLTFESISKDEFDHLNSNPKDLKM